jgi:SAM-dependent methyltransferase
MSNEWTTPEHALAYLRRADRIPHQTEGEAALLEEVPKEAGRLLDLGSGDGRLLGLLLLACPAACGAAVEYSPPMLERLRRRFGPQSGVEVVEHDLGRPLPPLGTFDVLASSFAMHHLPHPLATEQVDRGAAYRHGGTVTGGR